MADVSKAVTPVGGLQRVGTVRMLWRRRALLRFGVSLVIAAVLGNSHGAGRADPGSELVKTVKITADVQGPPGYGRLVSIPQGIDCNRSCSARFVHGTKVVLVAGHDTESRFVGWGGKCVGRSVSCVLVAERDTTIAAEFRSDPKKEAGFVVVDVRGPRGHGHVVSIPQGIDCSTSDPSCAAKFAHGTKVVLVAGHNTESRFVGWGGKCVGRSVWCVLVAERDTTATAKFVRDPNYSVGGGLRGKPKYWLYVTGPPRGGGTIRSKPEGISCPGRCEAQFISRKPVTLWVDVKEGNVRKHLWKIYPPQICRASRCTVRMDTNTHVGATFKRAGP